MKTLPIYELKISSNVEDEFEVDFEKSDSEDKFALLLTVDKIIDILLYCQLICPIFASVL